MNTAQPELDAATRQRLAEEVERLVAQGTDRREARQIVWLDYLDELKLFQVASVNSVPAPEEEKAEPPVEPKAEVPNTRPRQFWSASAEPQFTDEWLRKNRKELAKVKQMMMRISK
ncbi:hypothetical protein [Chromobacterium haemolyticum]|uniref:hypothetical protein n=1 Tax=Chromobacterium haemolyticum TaxID=394935 RepID=UPI000D309A8E|nr:hypothetical protein [Chromobacterium haemolyticum]PTU70333.1 hypothetical protein DBB33_13200 [Chromobacterium haemolyticum]